MESAPHSSWSIWISYSFDIIYNPYWEYNLYKYIYYIYTLCDSKEYEMHISHGICSAQFMVYMDLIFF